MSSNSDGIAFAIETYPLSPDDYSGVRSNSDGIAFAIETARSLSGVNRLGAPTVTESLSRLKLTNGERTLSGWRLQQ